MIGSMGAKDLEGPIRMLSASGLADDWFSGEQRTWKDQSDSL